MLEKNPLHGLDLKFATFVSESANGTIDTSLSSDGRLTYDQWREGKIERALRDKYFGRYLSYCSRTRDNTGIWPEIRFMDWAQNVEGMHISTD